MPQVATLNKMVIFWYKGDSQGHKVIDSIAMWKGIITWVCMQNINILSLTIQKVKVLDT